MKIRPLIALFSLFFMIPAFAAPPSPPQDDASEPPARYQLWINGKAQPMTLDKEISLDRRSGRTRFMISRMATRTFDKGGVKFDYPADYGFEADLRDPTIAIWALSGKNSLLMLQRFPLLGPVALREQMARELRAQYGAKNVQTGKVMLAWGGKPIEGKRLRISLAKQTLVQEVFAFSTPKNAYVLMIQDAPQGGKESAEMGELKALLEKSGGF